MKQHNIHNDEELYQQIMAELKPGADEYDTLMRNGQNPASRHKLHLIYNKYVAAACLLFAIIGAALSLQTSSDTEAPVAQMTPEKVEQKDNRQIAPPLIAKEEAEADVPVATESTLAKNSNAQVHTVQKPNGTKAEAPRHEAELDDAEQQFLYALITEVERRTLSEQEEDERLRRQIIEEISTNIINEPNNPGLTL